MYIKSEYKKIIEDIVKKDQSFEGSEHLLNEICDTVYKKTYLILSTKETEEDLRSYLRVISHKVIMETIRKTSAPKFVAQNIEPLKRDFKEFIKEKSDLVSFKSEDNDKEKSGTEFFDYSQIPDPMAYLQDTNKKKNMQKLIEAIFDIHNQMPDKLYYQIFYYKYCKGLSQTQVAKKVALSQGELSKRILELIQILKGFNIKL